MVVLGEYGLGFCLLEDSAGSNSAYIVTVERPIRHAG